MVYYSTRSHQQPVSPSEAVLQGLAPDGGLYIFDQIPALDTSSLFSLPAEEISARILGAFFPDIREMDQLVKAAYQDKFDAPDLVPLKEVGPFSVLELFHGPTCAFKDIALCVLPHLMTAAKKVLTEKQGAPAPLLHILTATSGDTGKAALAGFKDVPGTMITVFYPHGGVSDMQRLQMVTQPGNNVCAAGILGSFDDAQTGVKNLFTDESLKKELAEKGISLSSANSINIGRLIPQIMYYFKAYGDLLRTGKIQPGDEVSFCVPTGNFGDILAGYLAGLLGLPVGKLLVASNRNNVLTDFFADGNYDRVRTLHPTVAPSMDILVSSNLERLLYLMTENSPEKTADYMKQLKEKGSYQIDGELLNSMKERFYAACASDQDAKKTIGSVYRRYGYLMDPHTSIGWYAAEQYKKEHPEDQREIVVLSTASPYKFPGTVLESLGQEVPTDPFAQLDALHHSTGEPVPPSLSALRSMPELHTRVIDPRDMKSFILEGRF